ncbi:MAG: hypothetical protein EU536_04345 [Promethearchaeota archaeon]|nr:MAG: hypothetical protein EU536_04345 [Candidatus Lokiarchaeota archaeon]
MTSHKSPLVPSAFHDMFNAQNIAVIGASENPSKLGFRIVQNLITQKKVVFPVNPHVSTTQVYPSVKDVPEKVDLAVIIVPPSVILEIIDECAIKGIRCVAIITEGFRETGPEGAELQEKLKQKLQQYDIRAIGPNTMGFHDVFTSFSICFLDVSDLQPGKVSISSQTGVLAGAFLKYINLSEHIGVNKVIDLGNMIDLDHADVLEFLLTDEKTQVIALHMEGLGDGPHFSRTLAQVTPHKPVIIVKGGVMPETRRVVESHTGSLVGDSLLFEKILKQAGALQVANFEEFVNLIKGFCFMPPPKGNKVALISGSGGTAVITIDALLKNGLHLAQFSENTLQQLKKFIPEHGKIQNPVDIWPAGVTFGLPQIYAETISILDQDPNVDVIITLLFRIRDFQYDPTPIIEAAKHCLKPIFFATMGHIVFEMRNELERNGFPTYTYGSQIARVLGSMWQYQQFCQKT